MMDERLEASVNEALDGVLPPDQESAVREALERDPEAKAYHEDLARLRTLLAREGWEDPPPALKSNVLRAIRDIPAPGSELRRPAAPVRSSWSQAVAAFFRTPGYSRVVLGFAGGIAVGLVVFSLAFPTAHPDRNSLTGTMIHPPTPSSSTPVATRSFSVRTAAGTLDARADAGASFITVTLARGVARFEITFEEGATPLGVERSSGSQGLVSLEPHRVVIEAGAPGWTTVRLGPTLPGSADRVRVRVTAEGESVEETFSLPRAKN